jgi:legumain
MFYLEACESGSMFEDFPDNLDIYATTAANARESSWAFYCGSDAIVAGRNVNSCLGDLYSIAWMENLESSEPSKLIAQQTKEVVKRVSQSHVLEFGDLSIAQQPLSTFFGTRNIAKSKQVLLKELFNLNQAGQHKLLKTMLGMPSHQCYATQDTRVSQLKHLEIQMNLTQSESDI